MGRAEDLFHRLETEGCSYLDELICTSKAEEAFLDFKRSADEGRGRTLHDKDRDNLARALSGFANSNGGVIVWGVATSSGGSDLASARMPLADARRFAALIDGAVSGCTVPAITGVRSIPLLFESGAGGFVATLIPESSIAPHQAVGRGVYYIRAGSSFAPATHGLLAGLFGRPPRPHVFPQFMVRPARVESANDELRLVVQLSPFVNNGGNVVASDAFVSAVVRRDCGPLSRVDFAAVDLDRWIHNGVSDRDVSVLAVPANRIAPRGRATAMRLNVLLRPPFKEPLAIDFVAGCSGAAPFEITLGASAEAVQEAFEEAVTFWRNNTLGPGRGHAIAMRVLGMDPKFIEKQD